MEKTFTSLEQLRAAIGVLKIRKQQQEAAIGAKFQSPGAVFSTVFSLFKGKKHSGDHQSALEGFFSQDIVTAISKMIVPFLVNNVFFRKSGFITKIVATFLSQKAAKNVNSNVLADLVDKVKGIFSHKKSKAPAPPAKDYGIPPDSETY